MNSEENQFKELATALDNCSCAGLRRTMRLVTSLFDQAFAPIGLRCTQMTVLMAAALHGPTSIRNLADIVVLDASSLSRALDPLERDGLIVREVGGSRRTREIRITEAGMAKLEEAAPLWAEAQKVFISVIGSQNLDAFEDILARTGQIKDLDLDELKSHAESQQAARNARKLVMP